MWRSFFYALSVGLMVLGGEALVFESATINPDVKLPAFAQRLLDSDGRAAGLDGGGFRVAAKPGTPANSVVSDLGQISSVTPGSTAYQSGYAGQSRFGPSRFSGPASGGYGGGRIGSRENSPFGNFQSAGNSTPARLASTSRSVSSELSAAGSSLPKQFITKDWMPWSLIAVGGVIFLYTHSSRSRYSD